MAAVAFARGALGALRRERRWSYDAIRVYRDRRLAELVAHAREHTTLWRERLAHLDPSEAINLAQIPPITKETLMDRFAAGIADGALARKDVERFVQDPAMIGKPMAGRYMVATTSGTTGRVGYFVNDLESFAVMNGALTARILRDRLIPREVLRFCFGRRYRMAMAVATEGHFISRLVADFRPVATRGVVDLRHFSIMDPTEDLVCALNRFRPHYLHGYPTFIEVLAHERMQGRLAIDPEFVSLGSEPFSLCARRAIAHAFPRAQLAETYGATECLAIANQCSAGRLHVNEDLAIIEPVDRDGHPVPVGVASEKVYLTNLVNRAQPLLRYELTDSVTLLGEGCPCGSPMTSIRVEGRSDDTIFLADSRGEFSLHPPVPFETLFLSVAGLRQYQLIHEEQNRLRARIVVEPGTDPDDVARTVRRSLEVYLERRGLGSGVRVAVDVAAEIPRDATSHKLRQIYSAVRKPAAVG